MISKLHRFHGHASLQYLHTHASVMRGSGITLKFLANDRRSEFRAAVVVSKKVHKSAVVRNRIRRRVYELLRLHVPLATAFDLAVMVYDESVATMPAEALEARVIGLLRKAKIATTS